MEHNFYNYHDEFLPVSVMEWAGMSSNNGKFELTEEETEIQINENYFTEEETEIQINENYFPEDGYTPHVADLTEMNDEGKTFPQIADIIERNWRQL